MQTGTSSHIDENHHSETKNAETKTLETSSTATSRSSSSVKCEEKREDVVKQQFSVSGRVSSSYSTTAAAATASSSSSQLRRRLEAFSLRQNSAAECTSDSFRRSVETNENFVQYSEEYQDFSKLVDEHDFRGSSVSSDSGSSTLSDSRILRVTRSESGSPVIPKRKVLLTSASIDEVGQLTQTPLRIRLGSAAVQRATESCPNSPLVVKIKENSVTGSSFVSSSSSSSNGKSSAWSSGFFSSKAAIEEQAEELLNSSTETEVAMEEQEEKSFHRIKASTETSSTSSSVSTSTQSVLKTVNVSFGEHVNIKEGSIQRQQTMAEHRQQQRVVLTDSVSSSREGTPTRVPFERSVSAVAAVKRTDSGRSSSGLSVSQREILVNRSRSWNAIEANLFTSSGGGVGSLDHTILAEANGLIADMLMDHGIPPNIASGLKALQILLCPSQQNKSTKVAVGQKVELAPLSEPGDIDDCEEIPFTGEKPSDMSKTRRQLPRSLLRRMSTSTWSTTTSATGMPTLEPEPSRKRSTGARRPDELLSTTPLPDELIRANERLVSESSDVCAAHIDFICKYCGRRNSNTRKTSDPIVAKENDTRNFDAKILSPGIYEVNGITLDTTEIVKDAHLATLCDWDFDIFQLTDQSPKTLLSTMCYRILFDTGLVEAFHIPERELLCYLHALECGYRDIPYHNKMHAADVLHGVYYLTTQQVAGLEQTTISDLNFALEYQHEQEDENALAYGIIASNLPPLELLALYIAAAMHDFEHPGRTNAFIVATHAPLAVLYNDRSVLENHHAAAAWGLLLSKPEFNFLKNLETAEFKRLRYVAIECILATDLKRHFEVLAEFTAKTNLEESSGINWNDEADRLLVLEMAIKLSDINGPCKRRDLHVRWTERICEEFYEQGDEEAHLGLPISPFMDRAKPQLPKLQESFINHLVAPLCNAYAVAGLLPGKWVVTAEEATNGNHPNASMDLKDGVKASANNRVECIQIKHLQDNYAHWIKVIQEEKAKEAEAAS